MSDANINRTLFRIEAIARDCRVGLYVGVAMVVICTVCLLTWEYRYHKLLKEWNDVQKEVNTDLLELQKAMKGLERWEPRQD